jgi:chromate transporter
MNTTTVAPSTDALQPPQAVSLGQALRLWLKLGFTAPLTAITAAMVGVILNLAPFFAGHVLWPQGLSGPFDAVSELKAMGAAVALFRFKVGVMPLLAACALLGLSISLLR